VGDDGDWTFIERLVKALKILELCTLDFSKKHVPTICKVLPLYKLMETTLKKQARGYRAFIECCTLCRCGHGFQVQLYGDFALLGAVLHPATRIAYFKSSQWNSTIPERAEKSTEAPQEMQGTLIFMSRVARDVLAIPGVGISCERLFSSVKRTLADSRSSMTAKTASVDIVTKEWLKAGLVEGHPRKGPLRFLDLGCCPGGFTSYILSNNPSAGISSEIETGGHRFLLEDRRRSSAAARGRGRRLRF